MSSEEEEESEFGAINQSTPIQHLPRLPLQPALQERDYLLSRASRLRKRRTPANKSFLPYPALQQLIKDLQQSLLSFDAANTVLVLKQAQL